MTFILRFKNGYELPVQCEDATVTTDPASGALSEVTFRHAENNEPVYFNPEDVLCVYKLIDSEKSAGGGV